MATLNNFRVCQITTTAWVIAIVIGAICALNPVEGSKSPPFLLIVALSGCLGGVTNNYRRLQIPAVVDQLEAGDKYGKVLFQCLVSPLVACLLATIAYVLMITGLIEGSLFPHFSGSETAYTDVYSFLNGIQPDKHIDVAKALLWAIIAGFCETFVPNYLDKLAHGKGE